MNVETVSRSASLLTISYLFVATNAQYTDSSLLYIHIYEGNRVNEDDRNEKK